MTAKPSPLPTPRTDEQLRNRICYSSRAPVDQTLLMMGYVKADFARQLERENDELVAATSCAYRLLADISHNWHGRETAAGQKLLCDLRDAIARATNQPAELVQDEHSRIALAKSGGTV